MTDITSQIQGLLESKAIAFSGRATSQDENTKLDWLMEAMEVLLLARSPPATSTEGRREEIMFAIYSRQRPKRDHNDFEACRHSIYWNELNEIADAILALCADTPAAPASRPLERHRP